MKQLTTTLSILFCCVFSCLGQTPPAVTNVVTQVSTEQDKVTITYDLARRPGVNSYQVTARITLDGEVINAQALSGDVGPNVTPGYGKRIVWDVMKDVSELYGSLQVEVTAKTTTPDCMPIKTIPVYAGLSGAGVVGLGLILSGLKQESDSETIYTIYKENTDPGAAVYTDLSREEHYQDANSKHKKGQWLTAGGAAVILAGGAIMVSRLIQIKKYNKKCAERTSDATPRIKISPVIRQEGQGGSAGIVINF